MDKRERISVQLLGGFSMSRIAADGTEYRITEQDSTSRRLWAFLEYMSLFYDRPVSQDEIVEALWGDTDLDPSNTMKTLLHRARSAMEDRLGLENGKDVIQYRRGVYTWGPDIELELDAERFDAYCDQGAKDMEKALIAIQLYGGDLLPNAVGSPWTVTHRTYYHTRYLKLCNITAEKLLGMGRNAETARICRRVCELDPYDETCHLLLMQALVAAGDRKSAIRHYTQVTQMLMDHLGVSPSKRLTQFYRKLTQEEKNIELDLYTVRQELEEEGEGSGAFYCELATFQDIYRLEARSARRSGRVVQLAMITVLDQNGFQLDAKRGAAALEQLKETIIRCLRSGDTFTRFSALQYLGMLPTASYENGVKVMQRVVEAYQKTIIGLNTTASYSLLPVLPTGGEKEERAKFTPIKEPE